MAVYAMGLAASLIAAYKCHHRAIAPWTEAVAMTTRKPSLTEDWTHLGKLDTSRVLVRAEGAIWNGLAALGVPAGITKVLKWTMRGAVLAAAAIYSVYLLIPVVLVCAALWAMAQSAPVNTVTSPKTSGEVHEDGPGYRNGIHGYGRYDIFGNKEYDN